MKKRNAFTLAEVLITLGIIGIVAAMTLPGLVAKYKEKEMITQAKRSISLVNNALNLTKAKESASNYSDFFRSENTNDQTANAVFENFQVVERCLSHSNGCGGSDYKIKQQFKKNDGYGNVIPSYNIMSMSRAVLKDGSIIGVSQTKYPLSNCQNQYYTYDKDSDGNYILDEDGNKTGERLVVEEDCGHIFFDTNGLKGPNQYGRDAYLIYITPEGYKQSTGKIDNVLKDDKLTYDKFEDGSEF